MNIDWTKKYCRWWFVWWGVTSFYDFSLGKNAISMLLVCLLLGWMFIRIANAYKNNP
ncbi:MAG: hypothetical protein IPF93_13335 [Saprospiraceae bacterium]|nr:hypothetical protein [Saprospiraceae bacterium]